jgi:hypothetical protein
MEKLLEILRQHKESVSYTLSFGKPEILTIRFKDGSVLELCEHNKPEINRVVK